jgi:hypothetical protein
MVGAEGLQPRFRQHGDCILTFLNRIGGATVALACMVVEAPQPLAYQLTGEDRSARRWPGVLYN